MRHFIPDGDKLSFLFGKSLYAASSTFRQFLGLSSHLWRILVEFCEWDFNLDSMIHLSSDLLISFTSSNVKTNDMTRHDNLQIGHEFFGCKTVVSLRFDEFNKENLRNVAWQGGEDFGVWNVEKVKTLDIKNFH